MTTTEMLKNLEAQGIAMGLTAEQARAIIRKQMVAIARAVGMSEAQIAAYVASL